jgi:AraC family transcriptional activator of pobA
MPTSTASRVPIPHVDLYGGEALPGGLDVVNFERIPERSSRFDWVIEPHVHDALVQVLLVQAGGGEVLIDDRRRMLEPPCLVVVPAGHVHAFRFDPQVDGPVVTAAQRPLEQLASALEPDLLPALREPAVLPVDPHGRPSAALAPLFDAIEREARTSAPGQAAAALALLVAVFVQVARLRAITPGGRLDPRSRKAMQIERFRALVDVNLREHWPVVRYAQALALSASQLGRLCREVLGCPPLEVIHARLVHEARRELVHSPLTVKQVAALLGFDDEAYFGRFFRHRTGLSPTAFRTQVRRELRGPGMGDQAKRP